jgi:hypothetical protein
MEPPANPNKPDALSAKGEQVFRRSRCASCHTPPIYTNNKLVAVDGFSRLDHPQSPPAGDVMTGTRIGLDPGLATPSSIRDRFFRSRSGSIRRECRPTTARRDSVRRTHRRAPFLGIRSA